MEKFHNYTDINSLELMITEIEKAINSKSYLSALHMALSIPDMLGKLAYPSSTKNRYIKWFDENVRNISFGYLYSQNPFTADEEYPKMCGEVCYAIRNKLFHEGINDIKTKTKASISEFVLSFTDQDYVNGRYSGREIECNQSGSNDEMFVEINYLYVSCKGLCKEIIQAAKEFYKSNPDLDYPKLRVNYGGGKVNEFLYK